MELKATDMEPVEHELWLCMPNVRCTLGNLQTQVVTDAEMAAIKVPTLAIVGTEGVPQGGVPRSRPEGDVRPSP